MCFIEFSLISIDQIPVMLRNSVKLLVSTIKQMRHINQLLLIPMTIWAGLELTFIFAQFTQVSARIFFTANLFNSMIRLLFRVRSMLNMSVLS